MLRHADLGDAELFGLIRRGVVKLAGRPGRIYGRLWCCEGQRIKRAYRTFFRHELEALEAGYRPCRRCMPEAHEMWLARHAKPQPPD